MRKKTLISIMIFLLIAIVSILIANYLYSKNKLKDIENEYSETVIDLSKAYNFTNSPNWLFFESNDGTVYTVDWNNLLGMYGDSSGGVCTLMKFDNSKFEYKKPIFNSRAAKNVDRILKIYIDENENTYVLLESSGKNTFYKMDKTGKILFEIGFENKTCHGFYIADTNIFILVKERTQGRYYIDKYNIIDGLFIESNSFNDDVQYEMENDFVYSLNNNIITIYGLAADKTKELLLPGEREIGEKFFSNNGNLYYLNSEGLYSLSKEDMEFQEIFNPDESEYFSGAYIIENCYVNSKGEIYFIVREGVDIEYATILAVYDKS